MRPLIWRPLSQPAVILAYREHRRMPDVTQQAETARNPAQRDRDEPGRDHHQRHRRNVDAKHIVSR
jgi:hypothetical protein